MGNGGRVQPAKAKPKKTEGGSPLKPEFANKDQKDR